MNKVEHTSINSYPILMTGTRFYEHCILYCSPLCPHTHRCRDVLLRVWSTYLFTPQRLSYLIEMLMFKLVSFLPFVMAQGQRGTTKKGEPIMYDIEDKINFAVFPGMASRISKRRYPSGVQHTAINEKIGGERRIFLVFSRMFIPQRVLYGIIEVRDAVQLLRNEKIYINHILHGLLNLNVHCRLHCTTIQLLNLDFLSSFAWLFLSRH